MELDQIKAIVAMMKENDLSEFSMENDGLKIRIKRGPEGFQQTVTAAALPLAPAIVAPAAPTPPITAAAQAPAHEAEDIKYITSPMVGTFYLAPAPDVPPYVSVGQKVEAESAVCIIEAMKVMNEIKAEIAGTIVEVLAENAKPVEFGQKLFSIRVK